MLTTKELAISERIQAAFIEPMQVRQSGTYGAKLDGYREANRYLHRVTWFELASWEKR